jgi:intracellular septation protein A
LTQSPHVTSEAPPQAALKHWRTFGAAEWSHVKEGVIGLVLGSLLPVGVFYVAFQTQGFSAAVLIVLGWSALVFAWHYRRTGGADVFSATTFALACVKAVAGLASQNTWLYLAWPSLENLVYGTSFFGSALLGKPLLALYAERLYPIPTAVRGSTAFRRAFLVASSAWLVGHGLRAVVRLWLLLHTPSVLADQLPAGFAPGLLTAGPTLSLAQYLIVDTVAGWPINVSLFAFSAWYPLRALRRAGYMTSPRPITAIDAVELAVEETAPTTV